MRLIKTKIITAVTAVAAIMMMASPVNADIWDCGEIPGTVTARVNNQTLTISGIGNMKNYLNDMVDFPPWGLSTYYYSYVTDVIIEDGVTSIGNFAFVNCPHLVSVTIGNSVVSIGDYAFSGLYGQSNLTSVIIGNSVASIGDEAFNMCSNLTSIILPNSVTSIGNGAFERTGITSIVIPNSVTFIGNWAFLGTGITSVIIPNSVTSIGIAAFIGVTSIEVSSDNASYTSEDGVLFNKDKTILVQCPPNKQGAYYIPGSVTSIGDYAFYNRAGLTSITIPDNVTSIGNGAFSYCSSLTSITIPDNVTSIGYSAFSYCISLTSITIPDNVTSIGYRTFESCTALTSVTIGSGVTSIGHNVFSGCTGLTSIISLNANPPATVSGTFAGTFDNIDKSAVCLYVPQAGVQNYSSAPGWNEFNCINDYSSVQLTARPRTQSSFGMRISSAGGGVSAISYTLASDASLKLSVYDLKGARVAFAPERFIRAGAHNFRFRASKGFYIVEARVRNNSGETKTTQRIVIR
ncbi:MAG: leucine-rich repeat domain-containing protein [Chitinispirillales bacterium]|jgi:hypothetical protein|nr:leucine-rich repeat domain-containing protein [Chitinispirillales bacterium]